MIVRKKDGRLTLSDEISTGRRFSQWSAELGDVWNGWQTRSSRAIIVSPRLIISLRRTSVKQRSFPSAAADRSSSRYSIAPLARRSSTLVYRRSQSCNQPSPSVAVLCACYAEPIYAQLSSEHWHQVHELHIVNHGTIATEADFSAFHRFRFMTSARTNKLLLL